MLTSKFSTEVAENYLKAIYALSGEDADGAAQQRIAQQVGAGMSGVSKMLRSLAKGGLVDYSPYQPVKLTPRGEQVALEIIRHHRLLELYLMQTLGFGWEDVHREADRLEHYISEEMEERIEALLGFPTLDPHGDPIPTRDGVMPRYSCITLASQPVGATVTVQRVTDEDQALLIYLGERGIRPGARLAITEIEPYGGSIVASADNGSVQRISPQAAAQVFVESGDGEES